MSNTGRNDPCPCGSGKKWKKCHMNEKIEVGVLRKAYEIEPGDSFLHRYIFGLSRIRSCAYPRDKQLEYDKSYSPVLQNLTEMRTVKQRVQSLIKRHRAALESGTDGKYHGNQININEPIDDELNLLFKDFFIRGQMTVGALIRHAGFMGYPIGFLFSDEKKFRSGLKVFPLQENDGRFKALNEFVLNHRSAWYASFRELRRKIEHDGWALPQLGYQLDDGLKVKPRFPAGPNGESIEQILDMYWKHMDHFCEEMLVFLLGLKLPDHMVIVRLPEDLQDKHVPVPYIVSLKEFPGVPLQC